MIAALVFSLIESQLILPSHLAHRSIKRKTDGNWLSRHWQPLQERVSNSLQFVASHYYQPAILRALEWRYLTIAAGVVVLALALALFASGRMQFQFFPPVEGTHLYATLTMPEGTPIEVTARAAQRIEAAGEKLREELDRDLAEGQSSKIAHVITSIGSLIAKGSIGGSSAASNLAEVGIELDLPRNYSGISTSTYANRWRELTGSIPDAVELGFTSQSFGFGKAISLELYGKNFDELRDAAAELRLALQGYPGVMDVSDSFRGGKQEVQLALLPEARNLGLTLSDLGQQIRQAFYGFEPSVFSAAKTIFA